MEQLGVKQWRYRCSLCDFDAHLGGATENPRPPPTQNCVVPASAHYQVLGNQSQTGPLMPNGQNGQIPQVLEIFSKKTLFRK